MFILVVYSGTNQNAVRNDNAPKVTAKSEAPFSFFYRATYAQYICVARHVQRSDDRPSFRLSHVDIVAKLLELVFGT